MNSTNSTFDDLEVALRDPENIRSLRLGGLSWTELPESLHSFRRLEELRLVGIPLNRLPEWLGELGSLRVLEMSGACLGSVPDHLAGVTSLQVVKLRHCGIEHFPEHLLRLGSLRELDLSSNRISSIPPLKWLVQRFLRLDLSENLISSFPWNLLEMKMLDLKIVGNPLLNAFGEDEKQITRLMQQLIRQMGMEPPKRRQNLSLLAILVGDQARLEKVNVDDWLAALRHSDEAVGIRALKTMAEHWRSPFIGEKLPRRLLFSGSPGRFQVEEARHWLRGKGIELLQGRAKGIDCVVLGLHSGFDAEEGIDSGASVACIGHLEEFCATGLRGWLATPSKASSNATKSLEGLALSHESSNRQLALTMMQSGGVPKHLLPVMLAWAWRGESDLRRFARHWIGQEGPMWMRIFVEEEERRRQRFYTHWRSGRSANVVLEKLGTQAGLFAKALACMGAAGEWAFLPHLNAKDFERNMLSSGTLFIHSEPEYWNPLPPAFQEPISIKSVQFSKCKYDRWPEGLENVRGLKFLDLGSNSLSGLPQEFTRLQELEHLVLNKNRFAEFPEVLFEMGGLKVLEMSGNQLTSLPSGFSRLTHLQTIEFEDNAFKMFPESLTELPALFELSMGRKRKTGGMESLPESIGKMENLGGLHLENHRLTQLPEGFCLLSLKRLSLSGNPISEIPQALLDLKNLRSLHLSNCKRLKSLPSNIGRLSELDTLDLQGAGLRKLPPEMRELGKLRYLNLSDCEFDDFEETIAVIASMPSLQGCPGPSFVKAPSDYKRAEYGYGNLVEWARRS